MKTDAERVKKVIENIEPVVGEAINSFIEAGQMTTAIETSCIGWSIAISLKRIADWFEA